MNSGLLDQARQLSVDERIALAEAIWDSIPGHSLTAPQKTELDRRLTDHQRNPDDLMSWEEVKAAAKARIRG